jgi:L,D-transpeptidase catalytic domain
MSESKSVHHKSSSLRPSSSGRRLRNILSIGILGTALTFAVSDAADAAVQVTIDKNTQQMTVAVDGVQRYTWPVSSGIPAHETPNGTFRAFRMEADHFSKEWDDAPMPHSIFFTKVGHAIHGTDSVKRLGMPASHGCVRLSRENAATLYALVEEQGVLNTTVTLTGSSQVALARGTRGNTAVARGDDGTVGDPVQLAPRGGYAQRNVDSPAEVYVDQYGRPVAVNRNAGYANSNAAGRRIYQQRPQSQYEVDAYADQYYRRPPQQQGFFFFNQ